VSALVFHGIGGFYSKSRANGFICDDEFAKKNLNRDV